MYIGILWFHLVAATSGPIFTLQGILRFTSGKNTVSSCQHIRSGVPEVGGLGIHPCLSSWSGARTLFRKPGCFTFWPFGLGLQPKLPVDVTCDFCAAWSRKTTAFACYEGVLGAAASVLGDPIPFANYECMYVCMHYVYSREYKIK